jgi:beta-galactosidase
MMMKWQAIKQVMVSFALLLLGFNSIGQRVVVPFDANWKFVKEDVSGAEKVDFNDESWRTLSVPHDWGVEYPFARTNPSGRGGGYAVTGIGWYRKSFTVTETDAKKRFFIEFDGVMMNSDVWINGNHVGKRPYGYISFQYELTKYLNVGAGNKNVIAVKADNSLQPASRWYTGSGIYRHVRLITTDNVHVDKWGVFVSTPEVSDAKATVHTQTAVINQSNSKADIVLQTDIVAPDGKVVKSTEVKQTIAAGKFVEINQDIIVDQPQLWTLEKTNLYKAVTKVKSGKIVLDNYTTTFGIRAIKFDSETGFSLNGKNIKIKGVCLHHDGGAVGAAVPLRVWERRLELLKAVGANGIRTSHNPVSPEFLDLCDKLGFLVMNETFDTWNAKKSSANYGYNMYFTDWWEKDTHDQVVRDRNHPSVVIYSIGNEIHDNLNDSTGFRKYKMQQDLVHSLDPTRPVTMALFRPALSKVYENGFADLMDVVGQNYRENELIAAHDKNPKRKVIGTENRLEQQAWLALRDKPYMSGQFLWTGIDYIGEADWPEVVHGSGLLDRTGMTKHIGYQYQSWWSDKPMVFTMRKEQNAGAGNWVSDWTPTDIDTYDEAKVQVFSNCDEVELFLNDKSLGVKSRPDDNASARVWSFTFHKGVLKTIGRNKGQVVATQELKSAGSPAKIILSVDKKSIENSWDDVSYITATVVDENGTPCLVADNQLTFTVTGAGNLAGTDNGDLTSTEMFSSPKRFVYKGVCIALVKANANSGAITVKASADGLKEASITLEATPVKP